jgi:hypothetical protein
MLEDLLVDNRNVDDGEHHEQARYNSEEEEAVLPECGEDGEEWLGGEGGGGGGGGGVHVKQGAGEVFYLPRCDEEEKRYRRECCGARTEDDVAGRVVTFVTS